MAEDRELFESALSNEPPAAEPATPAEAPQSEAAPAAPEPRADATGRLHGDKGRFAPKSPSDAAPAQQQQPAQAAPGVGDAQRPQDPEHRVPLVELLNEREKRQQHERELADERRQREVLQRRLADLEKPKTPAPDIFENPEGFVGSVRQEFQQELKQRMTNLSFEMAHDQHGEAFETAYNSLIREGERGNVQAVQSIMAAANPGKALMRWHKQATLLEKTGGDLDRYLETHTNSLLDDETFLAKAAEKIRARANGGQSNGQQRPASVVQLPPSLNRVASAAPSTDDGDTDMSDRALFSYARR